ncbi:MAG TPA: L,D-transpeptidase family protein [Thermoanaerobaculia bacterium]|nr:L,D-transpeptidase family protein [Thermoanaerobaculia bacterium]
MRRPAVDRTPKPAGRARRHAAARQAASSNAAVALAIALAAMAATAIVVIAGCATGSPPAVDPTSARRGAPLDTARDAVPAPTPIVWLARDAILDAHLPELRWPDWPQQRDAVERFYADRGFTPAWTRKGRPTKATLAVIDLLERAGASGLTAEDYDAGRWAQRVEELADDGVTDGDRARFDLALTVSVMRYASDLHRGRVDPRRLGLELGSGDSAETSLDLPGIVDELAATSEVEAVIASLEPPHPEYRRLLDLLRRYRELARVEEATASTPLAAEGVIRPGDPYADLPRLAALLTRLGDLRGADRLAPGGTLSEADGETLYEGEIVEAVERFQRRHGLEPDGKVGKETLERLSTPLARRVRQIELALERWRWLPARLDRPAIVVNLPEFRLRALDGTGRVAFTTDVAVGRAQRHETPVFAELLRTVVFRPGWYVPASITRREILPELEKDPSHFSREGYEILGAESGDLTPETLSDLRRGALRLRQRPGPGNAMGPVKFLFPNRWSVYLHGTPSTEGFARARRDLSHGCMRVADPIGLAEWVLRDQPEWSRDRILEAVAGPRNELAVKLDPPLPVQVVYHTVVTTEDGEVLFLDDLYGHDARLEQALERRPLDPGERSANRSAG